MKRMIALALALFMLLGVACAEGERALAIFNLSPFDFGSLSGQYVQDITHYRDEGLTMIDIYMQEGVYDVGSDPHIENWVTQSGVLSDKLIDLDRDGEEELITLQAVAGEGDAAELYIVIFEKKGKGWVPVDSVRSYASLYPNFQQFDIALIRADDGVMIVDSALTWGDGATTTTQLCLYRYDGKQLFTAVLAVLDSIDDCYLLRGELPKDFKKEWEALGFKSNAERYQYLRNAPYKLSAKSFFDVERDSDGWPLHYENNYDGYGEIANELQTLGCTLWYDIQNQYNNAQLQGYYLDGESFFRCATAEDIGVWSDRTVYFWLNSGLNHFKGNAVSNTDVTEQMNSDEPMQESTSASISGKPVANTNKRTLVTTGSVNLREGPGLDYPKVTSINSGTNMEYLGDEEIDERGVAWYSVKYGQREAWVSSRYSVLR